MNKTTLFSIKFNNYCLMSLRNDISFTNKLYKNEENFVILTLNVRNVAVSLQLSKKFRSKGYNFAARLFKYSWDEFQNACSRMVGTSSPVLRNIKARLFDRRALYYL